MPIAHAIVASHFLPRQLRWLTAALASAFAVSCTCPEKSVTVTVESVTIDNSANECIVLLSYRGNDSYDTAIMRSTDRDRREFLAGTFHNGSVGKVVNQSARGLVTVTMHFDEQEPVKLFVEKGSVYNINSPFVMDIAECKEDSVSYRWCAVFDPSGLLRQLYGAPSVEKK